MRREPNDTGGTHEANLRRLEHLTEELGDESLPEARRDELCVEYAELAVVVFEAMLQDDDCDPDLREELRNQVGSWRDELDAIYTAAARRRLHLRWHGTENADIELDGYMIAELWHSPKGWTLTPAGDELGLEEEWIAPPGLAGPATDHAVRRAISRLADHIARISAPPDDVN